MYNVMIFLGSCIYTFFEDIFSSKKMKSVFGVLVVYLVKIFNFKFLISNKEIQIIKISNQVVCVIKLIKIKNYKLKISSSYLATRYTLLPTRLLFSFLFITSFSFLTASHVAGATTTLETSTSTDPSSIIIGPGTSATTTDTFTFKTDTGTDVITALVVALSSASSTSKVEITSNDGSTVYGSSTNPTGTTTSITLNNATLTATTATTTYKIRITPKTQANLPVGNQGGI